ncbi:MAG TPA: alpha-ketoglutarate-dependent dioxygenase AlkB [Myxococcales bacterium]|nr:alpha-ketoglutarate-dependent dioxygenase AlkB [Myxococcales bacterium]
MRVEVVRWGRNYAKVAAVRGGGDKRKAMTIAFQPSLFGIEEASFDPSFAELRRVALDDRSWIDVLPGWVRGADGLFDRILASRDWVQRTRWMYEGRVVEPRLTAPWSLGSGAPLEPLVLEEIRRSLSTRYGVTFDSVGFNLYRDGRDSVAWHSDKIRKEIEEPIVALVSLGEPRKFLLRPKGGGRSIPFHLGRGDLLVTGGKAQREWEHCVPKVAHAGPRMSLAFRHGMDQRAYGAPTPM